MKNLNKSNATNTIRKIGNIDLKSEFIWLLAKITCEFPYNIAFQLSNTAKYRI